MSKLRSRLPKVLWVALLVLLPVAIYGVLRQKASWRPRTLQTHQNSVSSVAFSPDGRTLAVASDDSTICLWNLSTVQIEKVLTHDVPIRYLSFSAKGENLLSQDAACTFKIWDIHKGRVADTLIEFAACCNEDTQVHFSPDFKKVVNNCGEVFSADSALKHFKRICKLPTLHSCATSAMTFSQDSQTIVQLSCAATPDLILLSPNTGQVKQTIKLRWNGLSK